MNTHRFYTGAFSISCLVLSVMDGKIKKRVCIKYCVKLGKSATKNPGMFREAFGEQSLTLQRRQAFKSLLNSSAGGYLTN
jgi:hypothetical protein